MAALDSFYELRNMSIRYNILPSPQYGRELGMRNIKLSDATDTEKESLRAKIFTVQGAIDKSLKQRWTEGEDFEVCWDFDYSYHACIRFRSFSGGYARGRCGRMSAALSAFLG